ncbi:MFS transporter [Paenibacillus sp. MAHUQ-46]|uniref:MFS transporter n=1 Tax=Paenibacillus roseus TaxID=2798579 RepID=A0A934J8D9_9BACL|nr:MFS transporter [Paenibacillus roseus]
MEAKKKWDLAAIASIPVIMTLANSMLIPILPLMEKKLNINSTQGSLIITVYAAVAIIFIPIAGYLSDRFGRKNVIIPSLIVAAAGGVVSGLGAWWFQGFTAYWIILAGRFIQGIGAAGAFPIVLPLIGDMFQNEEDVSSSLGIVETSNTMGKVLSPIVGSALALVLWYLPFLVIPPFCLVAIAAVARLVKVPKSASDRDSKVALGDFISGVKKLLKDEGRWLYAIFAIGGIAMFVLFGFLFYLSSILEDRYHIKGIWKGLLLSIPLVAVCLFSFIGGKFVGKNKPRMKWTTVAGIVIQSAALLAIAIWNPEQKLNLLILLSASGIGIGISLPCLDALITEGIEKEQRGTITSLYSSMRFIGVASGPLIAALIMSHIPALFYTFAAVSIAAGLTALLAIKPADSDNKSAK